MINKDFDDVNRRCTELNSNIINYIIVSKILEQKCHIEHTKSVGGIAIRGHLCKRLNMISKRLLPLNTRGLFILSYNGQRFCLIFS